MTPPKAPLPWRTRRYAVAVAVAYFVCGVGWILGSDQVIAALADDATVLSRMQSAKGLVFVALSAVAIYVAMRLVVDADEAVRLVPSDARERPRLRLQLVLLAGATTLPLIALIAYNVDREARRDQEAAARAAQDLARVVATDAARVVLDTRHTAEALGEQANVRALDASRCEGLAEAATLLPYVANAVTVRRDGSVACTALPLPQPAVNFSTYPAFERVVRTGRAAVGRLAHGPISGRWVVPIAIALRGEAGDVAGSLVLSIDVARLSPLGTPLLSDGGFITLLDASGNVLVRLPERGQIGANAADSAITRAALSGGDGHGRARGRDGTDLIFGHARVEGTDWVAVAAAPARVALAASRESAARSSILGALILLIAGIAAYMAGRGIERPMRAIARAARSVAEGNLSARAPVAGSHETAEVAAQLNRLLDRLPRIESQLRASERRLEVVLGAAQEAILVSDADDRIAFANGAAARLLGCADAGELVGRVGRDVLPDALADDAARRLPERRAGRGDRYEIRIRAHDGEIRWLFVSATPLRSDNGAFEGVLSMLYDVTERKDVEERLARMTKLYWALSRINEAIVRTTDRTTLFDDACRIVVQEGAFVCAFVSLLDRERPALIPVAAAGATLGPIGIEPLSLEPGAPFADGVLATAVQSGQAQLVNDLFAEPRMESARPVAAALGIRSFAAFPLRCERRVVGALAVYASDVDYFDIGLAELLRQVADDVSFALDVYERAAARDRAEGEVRELNAELERRVAERTARLTEANRELEAFSYSVSHDLRAPVRAIQGFGEKLSAHAGEKLDEEGRRLLGNIVRAGTRMGRLIDDLLAFAQLGRHAIALAPVALAPLLSRILDDMRPALDAAGARVVVAPDLPHPLGEPTLLNQVFANLFANAVEYRRPGVAPVIEVDWQEAGDRIEVQVRDNGLGIEPEDRHRIFEMFVRLHSPSEHPGTGIGLALAAKAAALMQGEITVDSVPGEGSVFRVFLARPPDGSGPGAGTTLPGGNRV